MPHIIVKHSKGDNLDVPALLHALHEGLTSHETITKSDIKTHALPLVHVTVGEDHQPNEMIHIQILMKPGRAIELKREITAHLHDIAREFADQSGIYAVSIEITELNIDTYQSSYAA